MSQKSSFQALIASEKPVLIDFFATWCGPCKAMMPVLKDLSKEMGDSVRIIKIDIDKNQQLASQLQVRGVPTLMIYQKGQRKWRTSGVQSGHVLKQELNKYIES